MKIILKLLLISVLGCWTYGGYLHYIHHSNSTKFIGLGVLILTLLLMPLFIYHRYKGKDLNQYRLDLFQNPIDQNQEESKLKKNQH